MVGVDRYSAATYKKAASSHQGELLVGPVGVGVGVGVISVSSLLH